MNVYEDRMVRHYQVCRMAEHELMNVLQMICPGYWVLEASAGWHNGQMHGGRFEKYDHMRPYWRVSVTNGDDNVTAEANSLGAAVAKVIHHLLDGAVSPLGGNGGRYVAERDRPAGDGKTWGEMLDHARVENLKLRQVLQRAGAAIGEVVHSEEVTRGETDNLLKPLFELFGDADLRPLLWSDKQ